MRTSRVLAVAGALTVVGVAYLGYSWFVQLNNSARLASVAFRLTQEHMKTKAYPASIRETDWWGHPVAYFTEGDHVVLVSYGLGGSPDRDRYEDLLREPRPAFRSTCFAPTRDAVFVDGTSVQSCLK